MPVLGPGAIDQILSFLAFPARLDRERAAPGASPPVAAAAPRGREPKSAGVEADGTAAPHGREPRSAGVEAAANV